MICEFRNTVFKYREDYLACIKYTGCERDIKIGGNRDVTSLSDKKFTEEQLQLTWCRTKPGSIITSTDGENVTVLSPGTWNLEAGPDFLNARLAIGGREYQGSVEIHKKSSDWVLHGHSSNPLYNKVILHVVAIDDTASLSDEARFLLPSAPVMVLHPRFVSTRIAAADKFPKGKCLSFFSSIDDDELNLFFCKAGMKRFYGKVDFILGSMRDKGTHKAFMELIFDACGYKQNRVCFIELFRRLCRYENLSVEETEAVIWGESGLLPDPASVKLDHTMEQFVQRLWSIWWRIRKEPLPDIEWKRSGLRPMNFPERRIAAVTELMKKMGKYPLMFFANLVGNEGTPRVFGREIVKILKCNHSIWDRYTTFTSLSATPAAVLGKSRAEDICINVVLPALQAHILLAEKSTEEFSYSTQRPECVSSFNTSPDTGSWLTRIGKSLPEQTFAVMPSLQSNRILETASLKWFAPPGRKRNIIKGAISQQGILHIYRNFCEALCSRCAECPLRDLIH